MRAEPVLRIPLRKANVGGIVAATGDRRILTQQMGCR